MSCIKVSFPGSCGELVQGLYNGTNCLVSATINKFVTLQIDVSIGSGKISVPKNMEKTRKAVEKTLNYFNRNNIDVGIIKKSCLPIGRGYASSSADIFASIYGVTKLLNKSISEKKILEIAISIEPSDSTLWKNLTIQSHKEFEISRSFCFSPLISILVFDLGNKIDTIRFNKKIDAKVQRENNSPFNIFINGMETNNLKEIGRASTLSALANQKILYKPKLNKIIIFAKSVGAAGICVAHSGSLIGVLTESDKIKLVKEKSIEMFGNEFSTSVCKMISGGPRFAEC